MVQDMNAEAHLHELCDQRQVALPQARAVEAQDVVRIAVGQYLHHQQEIFSRCALLPVVSTWP